jgi:uncharacterized protein
MLRRFVLTGIVVGLVLFAASPAWAHVTVSPDEATAGGFATLTFQVPNESDSASTTKLEVSFPTDAPIAIASVQPVPGWTTNVAKEPLETPVETEDGTIDERVASITWTAGEGSDIKPGEFQQFRVSVGLPDTPGPLAFPALQTYSDGEVVRWVDPTDPGAPEAEHPAPTITLEEGEAEGDGHGADSTTTTNTAAETEGSATGSNLAAVQTAQDDADSAKTIGIIAIILAVIGIVIGGVAIAIKRRPA